MYSYETERPFIFTDEGQRAFLKIRDHINKVFAASGSITVGKALIGSGDSWQQLACIDRLIELGEVRRIQSGQATQFDILVPTGR